MAMPGGTHGELIDVRPLGDAFRHLKSTDRAIAYRNAKGFDHMQVALSIGVQRMERSDLGGAGVMFSIDTETGFDQNCFNQRSVGAG